MSSEVPQCVWVALQRLQCPEHPWFHIMDPMKNVLSDLPQRLLPCPQIIRRGCSWGSHLSCTQMGCTSMQSTLSSDAEYVVFSTLLAFLVL